MALFNVKVSIVDLVEARTEADALKKLRARLRRAGFEEYEDDGADAFLSEEQPSRFL